MIRNRATALLGPLIAVLVAGLGLVLTPSAASAAPDYPPVAPYMVVNKGTVKVGTTVKSTGRRYAPREYVRVTITMKSPGKAPVLRSLTLRTDAKGKFIVTVKMSAPGTVTIAAMGLKSRVSSSASVQVIQKGQPSGAPWYIKKKAFGASAGTTVLTSTQDQAPTGVVLAGLGAMALAGSLGLTRTTIRRRRRAGAAA